MSAYILAIYDIVDPDYEPFKKIRLDTSANIRLVLARPFEPPPAQD